MPTPKEGYWLEGKQLPSVTTVLWAYNDGSSDGLIQWGVNLLLQWIEEHLPITSMEGVPRDLHKRAKELGSQIGTMAHEAIEWHAKGGVYAFVGDPEVTGPARIAYGAFLKWIARTKFRITHCEQRLTSRLYRYGGTLDVAGFDGDGLRVLGDWKTSSWIKRSMVFQGAAYRQLWDETHPEDPIVGGLSLIRFDKDIGTFTDRWYPNEILDEAFKHFLHLLEVYRGSQRIKI